MKAKDLLNLGFKPGPSVGIALSQVAKHDVSDELAELELRAVLASPEEYFDHRWFGDVAKALVRERPSVYVEREVPAAYQVWGSGIDPGAIAQMENAMRLPVAVRGALMPDAHIGYGLPIGGVLAVENAVIPYAVGVDIACRMRLSVLDIDVARFEKLRGELVNVLKRETVFGAGAGHKRPLQHDVLDADWGVSPVTRMVFEKARRQLGTSGSGNHFVEFGLLTVEAPMQGTSDFESLAPGVYVALLSHSGSRGPGAAVADHYSRLAKANCKALPPQLSHLAWLEMNRAEGQEYWAAMNLMGEFAKANHELIHKRVAKAAGARAVAHVENHHNFAWLENHDGRDVYVHRKGATPAASGVLGVIPGSMATPGFVVRGRGNEASLQSASHGAGRLMSRTQARNTFNWQGVKPQLEAAGVTLIAAGVDEAPPVYKDIHAVMDHQRDLVEVLARFDPKIVRMADAGEKPED